MDMFAKGPRGPQLTDLCIIFVPYCREYSLPLYLVKGTVDVPLCADNLTGTSSQPYAAPMIEFRLL
jgi:hypothetical protein